MADTAEAEQAGLSAAVPTGAIKGDGSTSCPPDYPIKGTAVTHLPPGPAKTPLPVNDRGICFDSVDAAEAAGQSRARQRPR